ncbi:MAG: SDR family NAD(P)-dependent oxidoreductase [Candidatus Kuenenia sp.]|nr:SDR family NAD(P)-dependent oxidoreductase [Candidatus Kuenenia hertensis]
MKKAIIIGATSGIGEELAKIFSQDSYIVGVVGRRSHLLKEFKREYPESFIKSIDVSKTAEAINQLKELISEMDGVDIVVISSGVGFINHDLKWSLEKETIGVNVSGFAAMQHFLSKGSGHLVGISSIASIRGDGDAPAYNASKAFVSNYLEGLRKKVSTLGVPVCITGIQPGYVGTAMAKGEGLFWVASPKKAAQQIYTAIKRKRKHAYITKRWRAIGWLLKSMPEFVYNRL